MYKALVCLIAVLVTFAQPVVAEEKGHETYDLLFRNGTLNDVPKDLHLVYERVVTNTIKPETAERDTGTVELGFAGGEPLQARLKFIQDDKYRNLGSFPASVGNPIVMYFVETVVRDMAETAGGSPFYIRNRVKDALVQPAEIENLNMDYDGQTISATSVVMRPFSADPNKEQMKGFGDLEVTVVMSDAVPGWYHSLSARVPDGDSDGMIYDSTLTFESLDASK
ncbi:hypothetical protein ACXYMO_14645 [Arenibacterium sp. CAU 1754]